MMLYRCGKENCGLVFNRPSKLLRHELLHTGIKCYRCPQEGCTKSYSTPSHLNRHMKSHDTKMKTYQTHRCTYPTCAAVYNTKWGLIRHEKKHVNPDHCRVCDLRFQDSSTFTKHMRMHREKWSQKCKKCGKDFSHFTRQKYQRHESRCGECSRRWKPSDDDTFECDNCGYSFKKKQKIKEHIVACYSLHSSVFICGYESCTRIFYYKRNLRHHIFRHEENKVLRRKIATRTPTLTPY